MKDTCEWLDTEMAGSNNKNNKDDDIHLNFNVENNKTKTEMSDNCFINFVFMSYQPVAGY